MTAPVQPFVAGLPASASALSTRTVRLPGGELATNTLTNALEWAWRVVAPANSSRGAQAMLDGRRRRIEAFIVTLGAALERHEGWSARNWAQSLDDRHRAGYEVRVKTEAGVQPFAGRGGYGAELLETTRTFPVTMTEQDACDLLRGLQLVCRTKGGAPKPYRAPGVPGPSSRVPAGWDAACEVGARTAEAIERAFNWPSGSWDALGADPVTAVLAQSRVFSTPTVR